jgi:AcrR family transcriptional regulator
MTDGPALPWWPGGGRDEKPDARAPLTREQIVEAAIRLADREGLEALSMRRLGQELGAGATSLYWHVRNKDQLLDLVLDEIIGEVRAELGPTIGWREALAETARVLRRVLVRHGTIAPIMGERPTLGPNALGAIEWLVGTLRADGFEIREAALAATTVINWAAGYAIFEARDPMMGPSASDAERVANTERISAMLASLPVDRFPNTVDMASVSSTLGPDEQFDYGLAVLLDGIALRRDLPVGGSAAPAASADQAG